MNRFNFLKACGLGLLCGFFASNKAKASENFLVKDANFNRVLEEMEVDVKKKLSEDLTIKELKEKADRIASELVLLPHEERYSQLLKLKTEDEILYAVVFQFLKTKSRARSFSILMGEWKEKDIRN